MGRTREHTRESESLHREYERVKARFNDLTRTGSPGATRNGDRARALFRRWHALTLRNDDRGRAAHGPAQLDIDG